ncbi:hypothetical protein WA556_003046 [Blastocystis sp. ATCC 50177/Nand II]
MSSVYGAIEQSHRFETIAQQISGKLLDLEKQIRSSPQLFQKETSDVYFQSVYSTLRNTITDLSNALSTSSDVVSGIFDKKRSEIESLNQRLDSLIASVQFAKGDATSHTVYDQFIPVPYISCTPHCDPAKDAPFVPFSEVDVTTCSSTSAFSQ